MESLSPDGSSRSSGSPEREIVIEIMETRNPEVDSPTSGTWSPAVISASATSKPSTDIPLEVKSLLGTAELIYRSINGFLRHTTRNERVLEGVSQDKIRELASQVLKHWGLLQSLFLLATFLFETDDAQPDPSTYNLALLRQYRETLGRLEAWIVEGDLLEAYQSARKGGTAGRFKWPLLPEVTNGSLTELVASQTMFRIALAADSKASLLRAFCGPEKLVFGRDIPTRVATAKLKDELTMLSDFNPYRLHGRYLPRRCPGSWESIQKNEVFKSWREGDIGRLWIHGERGCGKTVLASAIIDDLIKELPSDPSGPSVAVCYSYVSSTDNLSTDPTNVLGAFLRQLATQNNDALQELVKAVRGPTVVKVKKRPPRPTSRSPSPGGDSNSSSDEDTEYEGERFTRDLATLTQHIGMVQKFFKRIYMVIDGVDEGGQPLFDAIEELSGVLTSSAVPEESRSVSKLLALSRSGDSMNSVCSDLNFTVLEVAPDVDDIRALVHFIMDPKEYPEVHPLSIHITDALTSRKLSFRWAECQLQYLHSLASDEERLEALQNLPADLDETYQSIFDRVATDPRSLAILRGVLSWNGLIQFRPPIKELCEGLSVQLSPEAQSTSQLSPVTESEIARVCGSLLRKSKDGRYFEIAHRTVIEHFLGDRLDAWRPRESRTRESARANFEMAMATLRFVNFTDFNRTPEELMPEKVAMKERNSLHPFYMFACQLWPALAYGQLQMEGTNFSSPNVLPKIILTPEISGNPDIQKLVRKLFSPEKSGNFLSWILQFYQQHLPLVYGPLALPKAFMTFVSRISDRGLTPLHIAACMGLPDLCQYLVEEGGIDVNTQSALGSPLYFALVGPRILVNGTEQTWDSINRYPASIDQRGTVDTLINLGADRRTGPTKFGLPTTLAGIALLTSAKLGDVEIFNRIVERDMLDSEFFRHLHLHTLSYFPVSSSVEIANRAMPEKRKAFFNKLCQKILDWTILTRMSRETVAFDSTWWKADSLGLDCVKVENKRRIDTSDDSYRTLLVSTLRGSREAPVRRMMQDPRWDANIMLIDPDDGDRWGQTALHVAAEDGDSDKIHLLLKHGGADHTIRDGKGRTPLLLCETKGALKAFAKYGADFTARDDQERTIWHIAAANNDTRILQGLLKIDPNQRASLQLITAKGRTPLAEAFLYINELLGYGTHRVVDQCIPEAAQLLLKHCPKNEPSYYASDVPLMHIAAEWGAIGFSQVVTPLDEAGKEAWAPAVFDGATPFHYLNFCATKELVQALRTALADIPDLPVLNKDGNSVAETVFLNFKFDTGMEENAHPSHRRSLDIEAYEELLTDEVIQSRNSEGVLLWDRFCTGVILHYCKHTYLWTHATESVVPAVECLVKRGVVAYHEKHCETSGIQVLATSIWDNAELIPPWLMKIYLSVLKNTEYFDKIKDDERIILSLQWAVGSDISERAELIDGFIARGVSLHTIARGLSTLDALCHTACGKCDLKTFTDLVSKLEPAQINTMRSYGRTALQLLCTEPDNMVGSRPRLIVQRQDKLRALVKAGGDPNIVSEEGTPTTVLAIIRGQLDLARILILELGADLSQKTEEGLDVALAAASRGALAIMQAIKARAGDGFAWKNTCSVNIPLRDRMTSIQGCNGLHLSCVNGYTGTLQFYLENGYLDVNEPCFDTGFTPLHFASIGGSSDCVRMLVTRGADVKAQTREGQTPLHLAAASRHPDVVRTLLALECPKSISDKEGVTPFIEAVRGNAQQCAFLLLKANLGVPERTSASLAMTTVKGRRLVAEALEVAIKHMDEDMCRTILADFSCPADVLMPSCRGCTPLILTIRHGKPDLTALLLQRGASVFVGHCKKHFPLGYNTVNEACMYHKSLSCLALVLDAALKLGKNWFCGALTPIHFAAEHNNRAAMDMVFKHVNDHIDAYSAWIPDRDMYLPPRCPLAPRDTHFIIRRLASAHVSLRQNTGPWVRGSTALHIAMTAVDGVAIAETLLKHGADVDAFDDDGVTALQVAIREDYPEAAELLLAKGGTNLHVHDYDGQTPLIAAAHSGRLGLAELLEKHGADPRTTPASTPWGDGLGVLMSCAQNSTNPALFDHLVRTHNLDPYARDASLGSSALHEALRNASFAAYLLNGNWDIWRLCEEPDVPRGLLSLIVMDGDDPAVLPRLLRRMPPHRRDAFINTRPREQHCSPLCEAAYRGYDIDVETLLRWGADIEMEGCQLGTALMAACAYGREESVIVLVRAGARIAYLNKKGEVRNAVELAARYPYIVRFLLVKRYGQLAIEDGAFWAADCEGGDSTSCQRGIGRGSGIPIRPWGGIIEVPFLMTGTRKDHRQMSDESMLDYLKRLAGVRMSMRGRIITPYAGPQTTESRSLAVVAAAPAKKES